MSKGVYTIQQIQERLLPIFEATSVSRAILFGSYAKGQALSNSDVDIVVRSGLRGLAFCGLIEDVREILDKEIDMFDETWIRRDSKIENEIKSTGVVIYEK